MGLPFSLSIIRETCLSVEKRCWHYGGAMRRERLHIRNASVIAGLAITLVLALQVLTVDPSAGPAPVPLSVAGELRDLRSLAARSGWRILLTIGLTHYDPRAGAREAAAARTALGGSDTAANGVDRHNSNSAQIEPA